MSPSNNTSCVKYIKVVALQPTLTSQLLRYMTQHSFFILKTKFQITLESPAIRVCLHATYFQYTVASIMIDVERSCITVLTAVLHGGILRWTAPSLV